MRRCLSSAPDVDRICAAVSPAIDTSRYLLAFSPSICASRRAPVTPVGPYMYVFAHSAFVSFHLGHAPWLDLHPHGLSTLPAARHLVYAQSGPCQEVRRAFLVDVLCCCRRPRPLRTLSTASTIHSPPGVSGGSQAVHLDVACRRLSCLQGDPAVSLGSSSRCCRGGRETRLMRSHSSSTR